MEEFENSTAGVPYGITYAPAVDGLGAVFSLSNDSRIQYPFGSPMVREGTLEWWIKVDHGYYYWDGTLHIDESAWDWNCPFALIFTTDIVGGDVTWPGSTWLYVASDGGIHLCMPTEKYGNWSIGNTWATNTVFRFGEWHAIGISFGSGGQQIMLDGQLVASEPSKTQTMGAGGNHSEPVDIPTIGQSVSGFWGYHQYEGGFEGIVDRFRISSTQCDWDLACGVTGLDITIARQPRSQTASFGASTSFSVTAIYGTPPYTYQWLKDQLPIPSATNSMLLLTNLQTTDAGAYMVTVSDAAMDTTNSQPATLTVLPAPVVVDLISNGEFSASLTDWTPGYWTQGGIATLNVDNGSLHWQMSECGGGNGLGVSQTLDVDVSGCESLVFRADIMAIYQNLPAPGYYGIEYPANMTISYIDTAGNTRVFQHGFHYDPPYDQPGEPVAPDMGFHPYPGTYVPQSTWYTYQTGDLLTLAEKPKTITGLMVWGRGWNYEGRADNVQLLASYQPPPFQVAASQLAVARWQSIDGTNVLTLSWPNTRASYVLESSGTVTGGWNTVSSPWTTNGFRVYTTVTNDSAAQFFRLRCN